MHNVPGHVKLGIHADHVPLQVVNNHVEKYIIIAHKVVGKDVMFQ